MAYLRVLITIILYWCFVCTSNPTFGRALWDRVLECIFENFQKSRGWFISKINKPNMWLLVNHTKLKKKNTLYWNLYILSAGNYKSPSKQLQNSGQLQNNPVNGPMLITINHVIILLICCWLWKCLLAYLYKCLHSLLSEKKWLIMRLWWQWRHSIESVKHA